MGGKVVGKTKRMIVRWVGKGMMVRWVGKRIGGKVSG